MPSLVLMILIPIIFFIPNLFGQNMILPALRSVTDAGSKVDAIAPHISQWHGVNLPLILSVTVIVLGVVLALSIDWKSLTHRIIKHASITKSYQHVYRQFELYSGYSIRMLMKNKLNHYIIITLLIFVAIILYGYISVGFPHVHQLHVSQFGPLEVILSIVTLVIGIVLIFIRQRLTMVVLNGVIGFAVTLFFIAMKAPDLALTQLVVETITTILFIVSFSRLPNVPRNKPNMKKEIVKIVVSLITAMTVVSLIFITQQADGMPTISKFYENADKLTGGKNIVNAILGDFRALDTLFEGLVLIIAGLGIYTLLTYKDRRDKMKENDVVLRTVTKVVVFILLTFGFYVFFAGHNNPGGGFIGGLIFSSAFILMFLAFDVKQVLISLPIDFKQLMIIGSLISLATAIVPTFLVNRFYIKLKPISLYPY